MSLLLSIDTAGLACAVALSRPGELLAVNVLDEPRMHASRLAPMIRDTTAESGLVIEDVEAVAVSKGPGSFTGLRIGVSSAKGLAFGLGIPLVGVATFEAMALANGEAADQDSSERSARESRGHSVPESSERPVQNLDGGSIQESGEDADFTSEPRADIDTVLVTTAPSRRGEVYWQPWQVGRNTPSALDEARADSFQEVASRLRGIAESVTLVGEAAGDLQPVLLKAGLRVEMISPVNARPTIYGVTVLGHAALERGDVEDVASFEPFYLKEFVAKRGGSPFDRLDF